MTNTIASSVRTDLIAMNTIVQILFGYEPWLIDRSPRQLVLRRPPQGFRHRGWLAMSVFLFVFLFLVPGTCGMVMMGDGEGIWRHDTTWRAMLAIIVFLWIFYVAALATVVWKARGTITVIFDCDSSEMRTTYRCLFWSITRRVNCADIVSVPPHRPPVNLEGNPDTAVAVEIVTRSRTHLLPSGTHDEVQALKSAIDEILKVRT